MRAYTDKDGRKIWHSARFGKIGPALVRSSEWRLRVTIRKPLNAYGRGGLAVHILALLEQALMFESYIDPSQFSEY